MGRSCLSVECVDSKSAEWCRFAKSQKEAHTALEAVETLPRLIHSISRVNIIDDNNIHLSICMGTVFKLLAENLFWVRTFTFDGGA